MDPSFGVPQLAEQLKMSKAQLNRKLHSQTGCSPGKLILYHRMELAKFMLIISPNSVEEIAYQCGFNGLTGFSRKFKQEFGSSPSEYRKNVLKEKPELWTWKTPFNEDYFNQLIQLKKNTHG